MCYPCTKCGRCGKYNPDSPYYVPPAGIPCLKCGAPVNPETGECGECGYVSFVPPGARKTGTSSEKPAASNASETE